MAEAFVGEIRLFAFGYAPVDWLVCDGQTLNIQQNAALYSLLGVIYGGDGKTSFKLPDLRGRVATQWGQGPLNNTVVGNAGGTVANPVSTSTSFTLTNQNQLPPHTHTAIFSGTGSTPAVSVPPAVTIQVSNDAATLTPAPSPGATPISDGFFAKAASAALQQPGIYTSTASSLTKLNAATATATGGSYSGGGITGGTVAVASTGTSSPVPISLTFGVPAVVPPFLAMTYAICVAGIYPSRP